VLDDFVEAARVPSARNRDGRLPPVTDVTLDLGTHGPVLVDQSNGHTYRLIVTSGVVGTV
jgi:hypothetical protein